MYSEKCFNIYFHEKIFFQIFVAKRVRDQFFREIIACVQYNFH